jgi:flagellar assembly factor FliW
MTTPAVDVEFVTSPPGLSPHTSFRLERIPGATGLYALRAQESDLRLFLLDPASGDYGYAPPLTAGIRGELGASDDADLRVFVVANPSDEGIYLNLRAPIVIHRGTGRATQVILDDQTYPIRALLAA